VVGLRVSLQLGIVNPTAIADVVLRCVCDDFEILDREGRAGRGGFTNLKRILGRPADFAFVTRELARTVPAGHAVAGCDEGAWALAGAVALTLGVPAVLVRRVPKTYFVSYGDDPAIGGGRLAGERLPPGTPVHLIDDLVFSGQTLRSAREALSAAGLDARTASVIVWTYRADAAMQELSAAGLTEITCLTHQSQIPD
jgi:adenine/guanine phosphoribosyltransferase-like PRPP-binding protein